MSTTAPLVTGPDYPADYVELTFTTDEQTLADDAVANLQTTWPDWEPNDGDVEVVLIETLAPYASASAQQASSMPPEAFIALGTKLYGIPFGEGAPASTTVTLTFQDAAGGYYVPAGSEFELSGYAFSTVLDVTSTAGDDTVEGVQVVANDVGVAFNDLTDSDWSSVTLPIWVTDLVVEAPTSGGVDPQDTYDYLNTASRELQLRGRMIVTLPDFEIAAVNSTGVGRAFAVTDSARNVTVTLTDPKGCVQSAVKDALMATYQGRDARQRVVRADDASYTEVDVDYEVMGLPGFEPVQLEQSISSTLSAWLSPSGFGVVSMGQPGSGMTWLPDNTVRLNKVIATIGNVPGVAYVVANSVTLNGVEDDLVMPGAVALPTPGPMTGIIDTPAIG